MGYERSEEKGGDVDLKREREGGGEEGEAGEWWEAGEGVVDLKHSGAVTNTQNSRLTHHHTIITRT